MQISATHQASHRLADLHPTEIVCTFINGRNSKSLTIHFSKQADGQMFVLMRDFFVDTVGQMIDVDGYEL